MAKAVEFGRTEMGKIRAGKVTPSMLDHVKIDYYGTPTPIPQVANVAVADARTLSIQPFEGKHLGPIEKAIRDANLGGNPTSDGTVVRFSMPALTEERRRDLAKRAKEVAEDAKVGIRNHRREANDTLKKLQKNGVAEDEVKAAEAKVQTLTDTYIKKVDEVYEQKEQEIMTV